MSEAVVRRQHVIEKDHGLAFQVQAGETMRVIAIEGKQVGDMTAMRLYNPKESFSVPMTTGLSGRSMRTAEQLYSRPPFSNVMMSIVNDSKGYHYLGGRCTRQWYQQYMNLDDHRNCYDNIVEALAPFGVDVCDIPMDTWNIFMNVSFDDECRYSYGQPIVDKGDSVDFLAHMDLIVAISACPCPNEINEYDTKPLGIDILGPVA